MPVEYGKVRWYAVYTSANHEKRVAEQLGVREVEHFLPTYSSVRRWKDRSVNLKLPLFPGYLFVQLALRDRLCVLQVPGVVRLVGFNGLPCALQEEDIQAIQKCLDNGCHLEPHPYLITGCRVRIVRGPLKGLAGILVRKKGLYRVVLTLDLIARSAAVEVSAEDVERIFSKTSVRSCV
jgi:transcription antitermination factor NusG